MSNCTFVPENIFSGIDKDYYAERKKYIAEMQVQFPDMAKMMKLIEKKAKVECIEEAGNGSFNHEGDFTDKRIIGNFQHRIVYVYPEVIDISKSDPKHNMFKPKKHCWCFNQII